MLSRKGEKGGQVRGVWKMWNIDCGYKDSLFISIHYISDNFFANKFE